MCNGHRNTYTLYRRLKEALLVILVAVRYAPRRVASQSPACDGTNERLFGGNHSIGQCNSAWRDGSRVQHDRAMPGSNDIPDSPSRA